MRPIFGVKIEIYPKTISNFTLSPFTPSQKMSTFATRQLYSQALRDVQELEGLSNPDSKQLHELRAARNRVAKYGKEIAQADAENAAKAAAAAAKASAKEEKNTEAKQDSRPRYTDQTLACLDCKGDFLFPAGDQAFFAKNGYSTPVRCGDCRTARKTNRPQDQTLSCADCEGDFAFTVGQQRKFTAEGWSAPTRCSDCRKARRDAAPKDQLINCSACHKDFSFTAGAQAFFTKNNWKSPTSCKPCREVKRAKAETASTHSKKSGGKV